jgi:hypothetical protein
VRRSAVTVGTISRVEHSQIDRRDRIDHKPRQVIFGQPLAQPRRQQQLLLTITRQEVPRHARIVLTVPDRPAWAPQTSSMQPRRLGSQRRRPPLASGESGSS